jgi:hypothetical protein
MGVNLGVGGECAVKIMVEGDYAEIITSNVK